MSEKLARGVEQKTIARPRFMSSNLDLWLLSCILLLPFGLFWAEAVGQRVFFYHDVQYYFFPYHKLVVNILASGHLPLWNPYAFSGIPLLGDGQTAMFYPPNWLFLVLPPIQALTIIVLLHFGIAGASTALYVRSLGLGRVAALVAALAFMFNGFLVARVVHLSIMAGAALVPLVFWSIERLIRRRSLGAVVVAAAVVALQAVAGHPQVPIYTALGVGLYVLVVTGRMAWRERRWNRLIGPLSQLGGAYVVGYCLAAVQLVPWIEFASFSPRAAGADYGFVTFDSFRRFDWLLLLFPYALGGPATSWFQPVPPVGVPVYVWERMAYVGLLPIGLALIGLADLGRSSVVLREASDVKTISRDRLWALLVVLLVMGLIAAGSSTPFGRLVYLVPAVGKLRAYARAIVVSCFALVVLAAYGVNRLARFRPSSQRQVDVVPQMVAGLLLGGVAAVLLVINSSSRFIDLQNPVPYVDALYRSLQLSQPTAYVPLAIAAAAAGVLWISRRGLHGWKTTLLLSIIAFDMLSVALTFNPTTDPAVFDRVPESVAFLRRDQSTYRTASFISDDRLSPDVAQSQLAISWAIAYGIEDINGFNSLQPRRYTDMLFGPEVGDVSYGFLRDERLLETDNRVLSMLNVKYILVQPQSKLWDVLSNQTTTAGPDEPRPWRRVYLDDAVAIYRNPTSYPRAYFASNVSVVHNPQAVLNVIKQPGFVPLQQAVVEGGISAQQVVRLSRRGPATVDVERVSPNELRLHVKPKPSGF